MMGMFGIVLLTIVVVWLQGAMFRRFGLTGVRYTRRLSVRACTEGDSIELVETIANDKLLPVPWLRLESLISADLVFAGGFEQTEGEGRVMQQYHKSMFGLMPYKQIVRRHTVSCRKRGCYRLKTATMSYGDPLGLFQSARQVKTDLELLVCPRPEPIPGLDLPSRSWQGEASVRRWIVDDPFRSSGVRDYRPGDPLKAIHWKSSARSGSLQVHVHDFTADYRLMVMVNFEVTEQMWKAVTDPDLIERGIRMAAYVCEQALAYGMEAGFGCNGHLIDRPKLESVRIPPASGGSQLTYLLETMARLEIESTARFHAFLETEPPPDEPPADYVLITAFVSDAMREQISRLERNGASVTVVPLEHPKTGGVSNERSA